MPTQYGDEGFNSLYGTDGSDTIFGRGGNDTITDLSFSPFGPVTNLLYGEDGDDRIQTRSFTRELVITGQVTSVADGGSGDDTIELWGEWHGVGGTGNDTFTVLTSHGIADGGADFDTLSIDLDYYGEGVAIDLSALWESGTVAVGGMTFSNFETVGVISDTAGDDVITLGDYATPGFAAGQVELTGGNDTLIGGSANDGVYIRDAGRTRKTLDLGGGDDRCSADSGRNVIDGGDGNDSVNLFSRIGAQVSGGAGDDGISSTYGRDVLRGDAGNDGIYAGRGNDRVFGGSGDDQLHGDEGDDVITGGRGYDQMWGDQGADRFVFAEGDTASRPDRADRILDFSAKDTIDLSAIDADSGTGADDAFVLIGTAGFSGVAGELRWRVVDRVTLVSGDTDGDGRADFTIRLDGNVALSEASFVL